MNREQMIHLAVVGGVVALAFLIGSATGLWQAAGWLVAIVAILFHGSVFVALVTWFVRRVRRQTRDDS